MLYLQLQITFKIAINNEVLLFRFVKEMFNVKVVARRYQITNSKCVKFEDICNDMLQCCRCRRDVETRTRNLITENKQNFIQLKDNERNILLTVPLDSSLPSYGQMTSLPSITWHKLEMHLTLYFAWVSFCIQIFNMIQLRQIKVSLWSLIWRWISWWKLSRWVLSLGVVRQCCQIQVVFGNSTSRL